ncbi:MAG: putative DNA binding domain-containing protein [Bacteroidales bacterium]|nr:putative DNA binding domain-containing protein [Bacteroidales bacterium]
MKESQNIEYKEIWKDEYLKWICGFANAQGGIICIGKNDSGEITGLNDAKKLLEDIPNKVKDILGILVDVNLHQSAKGNYIEIIVDAYPYPVNYKGQYHYRSGSTKQQLKGAALDKFLLQKKGKRWDGVPVPNVLISDLKQETLEFFRKKALKSKRIEEEVLTDSNELIIENLQLKEGKYLKRASVLLFHPEPEKYVTGAYVKIGFFETDSDLIYQDEIHGNLFEQIEKTMNLLFTKYIKALISYEGINRVETYEYPKDAIREALLNAISHKNYSSYIPIQISVYKDKIMIWNDGQLPDNWNTDDLTRKHSSKPFNPDIANAFFRSGYIELWGRGTIKIIEKCKEAGLPQPKYFYKASDFWIEFRKNIYNQDYLEALGLNERQINAVLYTKEKSKITNGEYQKLNDIGKTTATKELSELVKLDLLQQSKAKGRGAKYKLK